MDGRVLSFRLAGINNQNFIMQDRETGSWWQQVSGKAILGPLRGKQLTRVFHDELSFTAWTREAPGGRVLVPAADSAWIRFSTDWEVETGRVPVNVHAPLDARLPPREVVHGIDLGGRAKAYPHSRVIAQAPLHDRVGGQPIVLLVGSDGKSVRAFDTRLDGIEHEFIKPVEGGSASGEVLDATTGSRWNFRGEAIAGPLSGRRLTPVYVLKDYWFDWTTYHPGSGLYLLGSTSSP